MQYVLYKEGRNDSLYAKIVLNLNLMLYLLRYPLDTSNSVAQVLPGQELYQMWKIDFDHLFEVMPASFRMGFDGIQK